MKRFIIPIITLFIASNLFAQHKNTSQAVTLPNPIMFVTQVPMPFDSSTSTAVFCNHNADVFSVIRGGDLYIIYPDGTLKNLTQLAGYGTSTGLQGANSIAVRQPCIHWSGTKALFSMVIGAPATAGAAQNFHWQIFEVTNIGEQQTPAITKIANQPTGYNNVSPIYGTDGRIIFTTDRPRGGLTQHYPLHDEYRGAESVSGLWSLDPVSGDLKQLNVLPSGAFSPFIDSYGRVISTRWDHLQRDGNADADFLGKANIGTFNYSDESANATVTSSKTEIFPEPQGQRSDLLAGTNMIGMEFNQFFPWQINEDGTSEETLNHVGRHDIKFGMGASINNDPNVVIYNYATAGRLNSTTYISNFLEMAEDPAHAGDYYGIDCGDFGTHASGQIIKLKGQITLDPGQMQLSYITDRTTASSTAEGKTPVAANSGKYRNPLPLSNGTLLAVHSVSTFDDRNIGTGAIPQSRYDFRIKTLKTSGNVLIADLPITQGISKSLTYYDPNAIASFSGTLWEIDPVEVRARTTPLKRVSTLSSPEKQVFAEVGVDETVFRNDMAQKGIALLVSRNVTHRDKTDHQQPFYLKVHGSATQSANASGKIYDIAHLQLYQADNIRGMHFGNTNPIPGRRILAQNMHDSAIYNNPPTSGELAYTVKIASDGSYAAYVPTNRAISWALTDSNFTPIVRERYWINTQPGEIRVCASCHGTNDDALVIADPAPQNKPEALRSILQYWKSSHTPVAPSLASPANDSIGVLTNHPFLWNLAANANTYHLQISLAANFATTVYDDSTLNSETSSFNGMQMMTKYYWRVSAKGIGGWSGWSTVWNFTTMSTSIAPLATILQLPLNNSLKQTVNPTLVWKQTLSATLYRVQISTTQNFTTNIFDSLDVKTITLPIYGLQNKTIYYWRVQAFNDVGPAPWSEIWNFTTTDSPKPAPNAPILISPKNDAQVVGDTVHLLWHSIVNATMYQVTVGHDSNFAPTIFSSNLIPDTSFTYINSTGVKYDPQYWKVQSFGDGGSGKFSEIWKFIITIPTGVHDYLNSKTLSLTNHPNPFSSSTTIDFFLPKAGMVKLKVLNPLGQCVSSLANEFLESGNHSFKWDASNLSSGAYYYRLQTDEGIATGAMNIVR